MKTKFSPGLHPVISDPEFNSIRLTFISTQVKAAACSGETSFLSSIKVHPARHGFSRPRFSSRLFRETLQFHKPDPNYKQHSKRRYKRQVQEI